MKEIDKILNACWVQNREQLSLENPLDLFCPPDFFDKLNKLAPEDTPWEHLDAFAYVMWHDREAQRLERFLSSEIGEPF